MDEEINVEFSTRRRRKSSFFRKSIGVSEIGDEYNLAPSETYSNSLSTTNSDNTVPNCNKFNSNLIEDLMLERKQWKETYEKLKAEYKVARSEDKFVIDWIRDGVNLTDSNKEYLKNTPNYSDIFVKYENLKETLFIKTQTHEKLRLVTENYTNIVEKKVLEKKRKLINLLMSDCILIFSDIVSSLNFDQNDELAIEFDSFLYEPDMVQCVS